MCGLSRVVNRSPLWCFHWCFRLKDLSGIVCVDATDVIGVEKHFVSMGGQRYEYLFKLRRERVMAGNPVRRVDEISWKTGHCSMSSLGLDTPYRALVAYHKKLYSSPNPLDQSESSFAPILGDDAHSVDGGDCHWKLQSLKRVSVDESGRVWALVKWRGFPVVDTFPSYSWEDVCRLAPGWGEKISAQVVSQGGYFNMDGTVMTKPLWDVDAFVSLWRDVDPRKILVVSSDDEDDDDDEDLVVVSSDDEGGAEVPEEGDATAPMEDDDDDNDADRGYVMPQPGEWDYSDAEAEEGMDADDEQGSPCSNVVAYGSPNNASPIHPSDCEFPSSPTSPSLVPESPGLWFSGQLSPVAPTYSPLSAHPSYTPTTPERGPPLNSTPPPPQIDSDDSEWGFTQLFDCPSTEEYDDDSLSFSDAYDPNEFAQPRD